MLVIHGVRKTPTTDHHHKTHQSSLQQAQQAKSRVHSSAPRGNLCQVGGTKKVQPRMNQTVKKGASTKQKKKSCLEIKMKISNSLIAAAAPVSGLPTLQMLLLPSFHPEILTAIVRALGRDFLIFCCCCVIAGN